MKSWWFHFQTLPLTIWCDSKSFLWNHNWTVYHEPLRHNSIYFKYNYNDVTKLFQKDIMWSLMKVSSNELSSVVPTWVTYNLLITERKNKTIVQQLHSMHPLPFWGWASDQIFKKEGGGLDRISIFKGDYWEKEGWLFSGGCSFHIKNKLKSEIFNNKNKKYNCSGPPTFKSQRVGYQSKQKLLHLYQH